MNYEETYANVACPPNNVNEWVEQQMAAIKAEGNQTNTVTEIEEN